MNTTEFVSVIESRAFDESKHVHYTLGQLIGTDEFHQEFAYLSGRDRRHSRLGVGYGTASGLAVSLDLTGGARITVDPGTALTPRGHLVCVRPGQCATLREWVTAKRKQLEQKGVVAPTTIEAHVVLGYRDCPTDYVLLPGSPCRDEDEIRIPSRVADSFTLELRLRPPLQNEEEAVVDYIAWLRLVAVGGGAATSLDAFEAAAAKAGVPVSTSPPESAQAPGTARLHFDPPPATLRIDPDRVDDYLRAAFRAWVTRLRPLVHASCCGGQGCCAGHPAGAVEPEDLVLLARVEIPVDVDWNVLDAQVVVDQTTRPVVLHNRMLQELAISGTHAKSSSRVEAAGIVNGPDAFATGGLTAASTTQGEVKVKFGAYRDPRSSPPSGFTYVVNILPTSQTTSSPSIAFSRFDVDGIVLRVTQANALVPSATINATQLMISVSRVG